MIVNSMILLTSLLTPAEFMGVDRATSQALAALSTRGQRATIPTATRRVREATQQLELQRQHPQDQPHQAPGNLGDFPRPAEHQALC